MIFQYFSKQIYFSRTFQESPLNSSTFQACANPELAFCKCLPVTTIVIQFSDMKCSLFIIFFSHIGVAPITHLRTCVIKIVTFKGGHLMW